MATLLRKPPAPSCARLSEKALKFEPIGSTPTLAQLFKNLVGQPWQRVQALNLRAQV